jgi:hypothetical protein
MKITEPGDLHIGHSLLLCPICEYQFVHIDQVQIAAQPKGEDSPQEKSIVYLTSDNSDHPSFSAPFADRCTRRHYVSLIGWCENCGATFAVSFIQAKGWTFVETSVMPSEWQELPPSA